jgi:hypothetical protein
VAETSQTPLATSQYRSWIDRLARPDGQFLFNALVVYYVGLLHFIDPLSPIERFSPFYFALVAPILLYAGMQWRALFPLRDSPALWLALFAGAGVAVSLARADVPTAYNAALMGAVGIVILNSRCAPSLTLLNVLFLASIPLALISQQIGTNLYGVIPQQADGCPDEEPWRVSLFPAVPESAFFSTIVLIANLFFGRGKARYAVCVLAAYFAIASSLRTALLSLVFIALFLVLSQVISMRWKKLYAAYFIAAAAALILIAHSSLLLRLAPSLGSEILNVYLYRADEGLISSQQLSTTVQRSIVWQYHFNLFLDHWPFGVGVVPRTRSAEASDSSASAEAYVPPEGRVRAQRICRRVLQTTGTLEIDLCSACSFSTEWLARLGIVAVFLLLFLASIVNRAVSTADRYLFSVLLLLLFVSFTWGVVLVPYNPIFLLLLGSVYLREREGAVKR